ncbi:unnamed protein product [Candidula unifasciata]|uniref:NADH dehydrogenase [ubiquinone] 1 alpha subcomplex subunit 6 n=1 Tax=Candidula unifasciata TaxID=100452 RepID=A0A8S3YD65_9EUPU|nr:unnamed protein product [Candidula unifasciata]
MVAKKLVEQGLKHVKQILSVDRAEARRRIPYTVKDFYIPITIEQGRAKVGEMFLKNKNVTDIWIIDMLVIKGQMELVETANLWKQPNHVMMKPKPTDFLCKFYEGQE